MDTILAGVANVNAHLDDLNVFSSTWHRHINSLGEVFSRLACASLTLNLAKCEFGKGTVTYLGRQVGWRQVWPIKEKVRAIREFPIPTTRRELCRFFVVRLLQDIFPKFLHCSTATH